MKGSLMTCKKKLWSQQLTYVKNQRLGLLGGATDLPGDDRCNR
jgi:hypothetical protein